MLYQLLKVSSDGVLGAPTLHCEIGTLQGDVCVHTHVSNVLHECPTSYSYEPFAGVCQHVAQVAPLISCPAGYTLDIHHCMKTITSLPTHHCEQGIVDGNQCHIHTYVDPTFNCPEGSSPTTEDNECYSALLSAGAPACSTAGYSYVNGECVSNITATSQNMGCADGCVDDTSGGCTCTTIYNAEAVCQANEVETVIGGIAICVEILVQTPAVECPENYTLNVDMCERTVQIAPTYNCNNHVANYDQVEYFCNDSGCFCRTFEHSEPTSYECDDPTNHTSNPDGTCQFDTTETQVLVCDSTDFYDEVDDECKTKFTELITYDCPAGSVHAPGTQLCITETIETVDPTCAVGEPVVVDGVNKCVIHSYGEVDHTCPQGTELTMDQSQCVSIMELMPLTTCPIGYNLDTANNVCLKVEVLSPDHVCADATAQYINGECIVTHTTAAHLACSSGFLSNGMCYSHI